LVLVALALLTTLQVDLKVVILNLSVLLVQSLPQVVEVENHKETQDQIELL
jgi:hypothetical protein